MDELHAAGFCSSYYLAEKFENCASFFKGSNLFSSNPLVKLIMQYMADNADHNSATLDGKNTLHAMGMMVTVNPYRTIPSKIPIRDVSKNELVELAKVDIPHYMYEEFISPSIRLRSITPAIPLESLIDDVDLFWKLSQNLSQECPAWFGFMQMVHKGPFPGKSSTHPLPIINLDPTDMTCIYSTLMFIRKHAMAHNVQPVVTFDQPLFWKAWAIKQKLGLTDFVIRLGSFHTLMSFLGTIGKLMEGSGIENILQLLYGESTVTQMLGGKAVSRVLRGHTMVA